jgi:hypothetical protein
MAVSLEQSSEPPSFRAQRQEGITSIAWVRLGSHTKAGSTL